MGNWVNWLLIIIGIVCVIVELALGALTGFDLALIGGSLAIGGGIGFLVGSAKIGLLAAGGLSLVYLAVFRTWLRAKLNIKEHSTNVDAVVGKTGLVTKRIAALEPGMVKLSGEVWRAELAGPGDAALEAGTTVKVESVEGVTLKVR
ncbi:MAG TPA: NfeD family protein [Candidatus Acidoferrum sp.]|nr:NfeD family protein [Candidatus Acidoferrum sp.]